MVTNMKEKPASVDGGLKNTNCEYFIPSSPFNQADCKEEFRSVMRQAGIDQPPSEIIADGKFHSFPSTHKRKSNQDCRYVFHGTHGYFCDWSKGIEGEWSILHNPKVKLSLSERERIQRYIEKREIYVRSEKTRIQNEFAKKAQEKWAKLAETGHSEYLKRKQVQAFGIHFGQNYIAIPMRDIDGKIWNIQKIFDEKLEELDTDRVFMKEGRKKGCFHVLGAIGEDTPFYVCEGYATAASIHMATGDPVVVAFDCYNLEPVVATLRQKYPANRIIVCGDDDQWKPSIGNIGRKTADMVGKKYGCMVVYPRFSENSKISKPTDWNDLLCLEGGDVVKKQLDSAIQNLQIKKPSTSLPNGFSLRKGGLYYEDQHISSAIRVLASTRDENQQNWGRLVEFSDSDNHKHQLSIPMASFCGEYTDVFEVLLSNGLTIMPGRKARHKLVEYLQNAAPFKKVLCVTRIGWHKNAFILPSETIPLSDEVYFQTEHIQSVDFQSKGTLVDWQEKIAKPCKGNSRLIFSLSCAFAAPLFYPLSEESGGFNLKGASSIGKSTALWVAASVWGGPKFVQQWKATGNALEAVAEAHNNAILCLDELGQVNGQEAGEVAYMLANGVGKNRMKAKGGVRKKYTWNTLFLSTGEVSIAEKLCEFGKKTQAGMVTRIVDIPADAGKKLGLFDTINDFDDGSTFAQYLKSQVASYHGTAIREYLTKLVPHIGELSEKLHEIRTIFLQKIPKDADGQVKRIVQRFALSALGGELAIAYGVLPYQQGDATEACCQCFDSWLMERGNTGSYETEKAMQQVRAFFESNYSTRFAMMPAKNDTNQNMPRIEEAIIKQAGFKRQTQDGHEFFVFPEVFRQEVCKGYDVKFVCHEMVRRGWLIRGNDRQFIKPQRLPIGNKKVYHINHLILTDAQEEGVTGVTGVTESQ